MYEWPLPWIAGSWIHESIELRLFFYSISTMFAVMIYQGMNPAIYYLVGMGVYFWAYCDGEVSQPAGLGRRTRMLTLSGQVVCSRPWKLPHKPSYYGKPVEVAWPSAGDRFR